MERSDRSPTDKELLHDFARGGCEESFNVFLQRHKLTLFNIAYRVLYDSHGAEDVVQEAFIQLAAQKAKLANVQSPRSWLCAIALNLSLDMQKSMRRRKRREKAGEHLLSAEAPREAAIRSELRKELDLALASLKNSFRVPIILRYLQEMSYEEAGDVMDIPPDTLRKRVSKGLRLLRRLLTARGVVIPIVAVEAGLRGLPAKAASATFLTSASSIIRAVSATGIAAKVAASEE